VLVWRDRDEADDRADSAEALVEASVAAEKVARDAVTRMTTYSYRTVEEDFSWSTRWAPRSSRRTSPGPARRPSPTSRR
jgi:hypothetical protein